MFGQKVWEELAFFTFAMCKELVGYVGADDVCSEPCGRAWCLVFNQRPPVAPAHAVDVGAGAVSGHTFSALSAASAPGSEPAARTPSMWPCSACIRAAAAGAAAAGPSAAKASCHASARSSACRHCSDTSVAKSPVPVSVGSCLFSVVLQPTRGPCQGGNEVLFHLAQPAQGGNAVRPCHLTHEPHTCKNTSDGMIGGPSFDYCTLAVG